MFKSIMLRFLIWSIVLLPAGAVVGYHLGHRQYRSVGLLHINPVMEKILYTNEVNAQIPMFDEYMNVEAARVSSRRVLDKALADRIWLSWRSGMPAGLCERIANELTVDHPSGGGMLSATVWDSDPTVAQLAVRTIVQSYQQIYEEDQLMSQNHLMTVLQGRLEKEEADVKTISTSIRAVAARYGTDDLLHLFDKKCDELDDLKKRLDDASAEVGQSSEVVTRLKSAVEKSNAEWLQMSRDKMDLDDLKEEKARAEAALHQTQDRIDSLQLESSGTGSRLDIVSDGDSPSPEADVSDTHFSRAALGGGAGLAAAATLALTFGWRRRTA